MAFVWLNGQFVEEEQAAVSVRDTGLLHSAGLFTTMRAYAGRVFRLVEHLRRLRKSAEVLFVPIDYKDDPLADAVAELLERNQLADARLRLTVTRGQSAIDPLHGMMLTPNCFLTASPFEPYPREFYEKGMTVAVLDDQKLNPYDIQAGHKTLNYFSRLAALRDAARKNAGEALWFNVHNYLQSGSISNVFLIKDGTLLTPPTRDELLQPEIAAGCPYPKSATLPGITRAAAIELATSAGFGVRRAPLTIHDLLSADEVFLSNSIMGIMPVCRVEGHAVGPDKPGPITLQLSDAYARQVLE